MLSSALSDILDSSTIAQATYSAAVMMVMRAVDSGSCSEMGEATLQMSFTRVRSI